MSQTVIGFFDDHSEAQRAVEQLQKTGISRDRIDISRGGTGAGSSGSNVTGSADVNPVSGSARDENSVSRTSDGRTVDQEGRNTNVFTDFFNNLFGGSDDKDKDKDKERYSRVASQSGAMVTVHAGSRDEAERAADILDDCGAVDVDERDSQYGNSDTAGSGEGSGRSSVSGAGDVSLNQGTGGGSQRLRSRIFDRKIEDDWRLRSQDTNDAKGYGTGNTDSGTL